MKNLETKKQRRFTILDEQCYDTASVTLNPLFNNRKAQNLIEKQSRKAEKKLGIYQHKPLVSEPNLKVLAENSITNSLSQNSTATKKIKKEKMKWEVPSEEGKVEKSFISKCCFT